MDNVEAHIYIASKVLTDVREQSIQVRIVEGMLKELITRRKLHAATLRPDSTTGGVVHTHYWGNIDSYCCPPFRDLTQGLG